MARVVFVGAYAYAREVLEALPEAPSGIVTETRPSRPRWQFIAGKVEDLLKQTVIVEHSQNNFDSTFLQYALGCLPWRCTVNTMWLARALLPRQKRYDLRSLCKTMLIDVPEQHSALADALATAKLFIALVEKAHAEFLPLDGLHQQLGLGGTDCGF